MDLSEGVPECRGRLYRFHGKPPHTKSSSSSMDLISEPPMGNHLAAFGWRNSIAPSISVMPRAIHEDGCA